MADDAESAGVLLGGNANRGDPAVAKAARQAEHARSVRGDPHARLSPYVQWQVEHGIAQLPELAVVRDGGGGASGAILTWYDPSSGKRKLKGMLGPFLTFRQQKWYMAHFWALGGRWTLFNQANLAAWFDDNVVDGDTVAPLPVDAMSAGPPEDDWRLRYNTRWVPRDAFDEPRESRAATAR